MTDALLPAPAPGLPDARTAAPAGTLIPRAWLVAPPLLLAVLLLLEQTNIDRGFSAWFFNTADATFPLRHTFWLDTVMHYWTKYAVILVTCLVIAALLFTAIAPALRPRRRLLAYTALALTLAPLTVTALKQVTDRPCPWDLIEYGGAVPYSPLFASRPLPHAPAQCFPAGHASTGFALMAFYFAAHRDRRRVWAQRWLLFGIAAGLLLGIGRVAQGAHFLSHVLWSGLVCWVVMVALYGALFRRPPAPAGGMPST